MRTVWDADLPEPDGVTASRSRRRIAGIAHYQGDCQPDCFLCERDARDADGPGPFDEVNA